MAESPEFSKTYMLHLEKRSHSATVVIIDFSEVSDLGRSMWAGLIEVVKTWRREGNVGQGTVVALGKVALASKVCVGYCI